MARRKVKLQWIVDDSARKASFKKRQKGLVKKVSELSTLCGVSACAIIHSPYEPEPQVWPNATDAHRVVMRFKSMPDTEQSKNMMDQKGFLFGRINKLMEYVVKKQKENQLCEVAELMSEVLIGRASINDVGMENLSILACMLEKKMKAVKDQIEVLHNMMGPSVAAPPLHHAIMEDQSGVTITHRNNCALDEVVEGLKKEPWFMEMMNERQKNIGGQ